MTTPFKTPALAALALLAAFTLPAHAAVKVLACEPEWGALAQEIAGDLVDVGVATTAMQDPHQVQAKPSLIARARNADMVVCTGAELEIGWLPVLLQQSGNPKLQPGQPGNFAAADFVRKLDVPKQVDRSQGDVHPDGNPHIQTDPRTSRSLPLHSARALRWSIRRTRRSTRNAPPRSRRSGRPTCNAGPCRPGRSRASPSPRTTRPMPTWKTGWA